MSSNKHKHSILTARSLQAAGGQRAPTWSDLICFFKSAKIIVTLCSAFFALMAKNASNVS